VTNVIDLAAYRAARAHRVSRMTDDAAWETAISSHLVCADTGIELAGVPMVQLVKSAPAGEAFWGRTEAGVWFWVDPAPHNLEWMRKRGWHLQQVRLVPDAKRSKGGE
jgi:hypothetical protein